MRRAFPLFQSHLDLAHGYWEKLLKAGDSALDATCGNGRDTLALARLLFSNSSASSLGTLYAIDNKQEALTNTLKLLQDTLPSPNLEHIKLHLQCHATLPCEILPASLRLVVYNLGYLPGHNKQLTTHASTTLASVQAAMPLVMPGGCISITAYPGHPEGAQEEVALLHFCETLLPQEWNVCYHRFCNRRKSPSLFLLQRALCTASC